MKRLFFTISAGMFVALVLSSFLASQVMRLTFDQKMREKFHARHRSEAEFIVKTLEQAPEETLDDELQRLESFIFQSITVVPYTEETIPGEVRDELRQFGHAIFRDKNGPREYHSIHGNKRLVVIGPMPRPFPFELMHLLMVMGIMLPIIGLTGFLLTAPVARRLRKLEKAAIALGEGKLTARVDVHSSDVIGQLSQRFNEMADRIQLLLEGQRHLLQAVSHELRTPISRIGFNLEILSTVKDEEEKARRIAQIGEEMNELSDLVGELLLYTRFDSGTTPIKKSTISVPEALQEVLDRLDPPRHDCAIEIESPADLKVTANRVYFKRAIQNLLLNAVRYARGKVVIRCQAVSTAVVIEVQDDGPGIPPAERERIFEPFTRVDDSRSRESGGAGLGLAIVRRILESHGGTVDLADDGPPGARFVMRWPGEGSFPPSRET